MKTAEKMRMVGQPLEMGDSLTRYLQEISYHELLTADEEVELAQAIEAGREAEEQLAAVSQAIDQGEVVDHREQAIRFRCTTRTRFFATWATGGSKT